MTVKDYYYLHFAELSPEKQFHFATRIKNYFKVHDFDDYLINNQPSTNISDVINNNNYSMVNNHDLRKPFFEKYQGIYGIEAALFRVHHLLIEYGIDLTIPIEKYETGSNTIYSIGFGALLICLDDEITTKVCDSIIELSKDSAITRVVFKDNGFVSDSDKTNIKEILRINKIDEFRTI